MVSCFAVNSTDSLTIVSGWCRGWGWTRGRRRLGSRQGNLKSSRKSVLNFCQYSNAEEIFPFLQFMLEIWLTDLIWIFRELLYGEILLIFKLINFNMYSRLACMISSCMIPNIASTVCPNAADSEMLFALKSVLPKPERFICVAVTIAQLFLIAIARRSSAICLMIFLD